MANFTASVTEFSYRSDVITKIFSIIVMKLKSKLPHLQKESVPIGHTPMSHIRSWGANQIEEL